MSHFGSVQRPGASFLKLQLGSLEGSSVLSAVSSLAAYNILGTNRACVRSLATGSSARLSYARLGGPPIGARPQVHIGLGKAPSRTRWPDFSCGEVRTTDQLEPADPCTDECMHPF